MREKSFKRRSVLKTMFIIGAAVDGAIAVSWLMIAAGVAIPNILNGYAGTGEDYRLAMYVAGMFMAGWTLLLIWGAASPEKRKGLLLITSGMLLLSIVVEVAVWYEILAGPGFIFGAAKRLVISVMFISAWLYSDKNRHALPGGRQVGCI